MLSDLSKIATAFTLLLKAYVSCRENLVSNYSPQGVIEDNNVDGDAAPTDVLQQNVHFTDDNAGEIDDRGTITDPLRTQLEDPLLALTDFFKRPVRLETSPLLWDVSTTADFNITFDPWAVFFENKRVINRISNFKLLKATMHVKFVLNGNAFYYGRMLASYRPLPNFDSTTVYVPNNFDDNVEASQRLHVYLDPTKSEGASLVLPFFTPLNMLDIVQQQWRDMGRVTLQALTPLKHANAGVDPISITTFIWAENVELVGLTQANPGAGALVPQGVIEPQGEAEGIISKPASTVAKTAGILKQIPIISSFATATEIGARAIATMAAIFGYSKPRTDNYQAWQPISRQSMANCDGCENLLTLTVDTKQELSIDPTVASLDVNDEMTITSIACRESLLTAFGWPTGVKTEKMLFNIVVDPCVVRQSASGSNVPIHMPACAFATFPFQYWKGTMRYRFQVVCSGYHRGRLKFVYDPYGVPQSLGQPSETEYNVAYTQIVDISENTDFTIDVGWGQNTPFRRHIMLPQNQGSTFSPFSATGAVTPLGLNSANLSGVGNGTLSVYVVNELTVPNTTVNNDITILVSISAAEDFEVAVPTEATLSTLNLTQRPDPETPTRMSPQGVFEEAPPRTVTSVVSPETLWKLGSPCPQDALVNKIHYGEVIGSFRQLLKRYCLHETIALPTNSVFGPTSVRIVRKMFPFYGGFSNEPDSLSALLIATPKFTSNSYTYADMTLLNYLSAAYGGWRGSIRYCIDTTPILADTNDATNGTWSVGRISTDPRDTNADLVEDDIATAGEQPMTDTTQVRYGGLKVHERTSGLSGLARWNSLVNPLQTFEIPYYSMYRFAPAKSTRSWSADFSQDMYQMICTMQATPSPPPVFKYVAAGEDFTLFWYLGPPIFYRYGPPTPAEL
jgi:hypothetical protein